MEVGVKYIPSLKARADFSLGFGGSRIEVASHANVLRGSSRVLTPRTERNDCVNPERFCQTGLRFKDATFQPNSQKIVA